MTATNGSPFSETFRRFSAKRFHVKDFAGSGSLFVGWTHWYDDDDNNNNRKNQHVDSFNNK